MPVEWDNHAITPTTEGGGPVIWTNLCQSYIGSKAV